MEVSVFNRYVRPNEQHLCNDGAKTFSKMPFTIRTLSITTIVKMALSITRLIIMGYAAIPSISITVILCNSSECR
jgi:hypothetical protein